MALAILRRHAPDCNRHQVLAALDAGGSPQEGDSPVIVLFRRWFATYSRINEADSSFADSEITALAERQFLLKEAMFRVPSQDARDHLAKIIVSTTFGDHNLEDDGSSDFWIEAGKLMAGS